MSIMHLIPVGDDIGWLCQLSGGSEMVIAGVMDTQNYHIIDEAWSSGITWYYPQCCV